MKYLKITTIAIVLLSVFLVACDQDDDVSVKHVYTDEEIAYADSLAAAQANINADKFYTYEITMPIDTVNYSGVDISIETTELLQDLEYSDNAALTTALGEVTGGTQTGNQVDFLAINSSTGYDYGGGYTANGFGYWFDGSGDVVSWGDTDAIFAEWDMETFTASLGQHPTRLETDQEIQLIHIFQKGEYRVAVVFNITGGEYLE
ncbi:protein of unknown function [Pustulibacterium marinum]|uniref:DUF4859 domain-containing protein n=1 Tax=Pustulibacterium marinum TaxID=1224947 RepID=A0A1I7GWJ1_9FLAO|nr:DUF4859 domain-containing protein [Pustulibacterium marinum]SFU52790.1 protein of unknown function [Pustulibacterium marinum]